MLEQTKDKIKAVGAIVVGLLLAPFTFGLSLILSAAGLISLAKGSDNDKSIKTSTNTREGNVQEKTVETMKLMYEKMEKLAERQRETEAAILNRFKQDAHAHNQIVGALKQHADVGRDIMERQMLMERMAVESGLVSAMQRNMSRYQADASYAPHNNQNNQGQRR